MNIKRLAVLASVASAVGIIYAVNSFKSLMETVEFDFDEDLDDDGKI